MRFLGYRARRRRYIFCSVLLVAVLGVAIARECRQLPQAWRLTAQTLRMGERLAESVHTRSLPTPALPAPVLVAAPAPTVAPGDEGSDMQGPWFLRRFGGVSTAGPMALILEGVAPQRPTPIYLSYDEKSWRLLPSHDVATGSGGSLRVTRTFSEPTVLLAKFPPYTEDHLAVWLKKIRANQHVIVSDLGRSAMGRVIPIVTVTEGTAGRETASKQRKQRVVIYARLHPGEAASSYLIEGLVTYLLGDSATASTLRRHLVFTIIPMGNVDGVAAGASRLTPRGDDLDQQLFSQLCGAENRVAGNGAGAADVKLMRSHLQVLLRLSLPLSLAVNVHTSIDRPRATAMALTAYTVQPFLPADGELKLQRLTPGLGGSAPLGAAVPSRFELPPLAGLASFAGFGPASWWWRQVADQGPRPAGASGRFPPIGNWLSPDDWRRQGAELARAIAGYHGWK